MGDVEEADRRDARVATTVTGILGELNVLGVLDAADVHVATRVAALVDEADEAVLLGLALAVRGPRLAHVCIDLATVSTTVTSELDEPVDLDGVRWPDVASWIGLLAASPLVATDSEPARRPLRLEGTRLYLDRYWRQECTIADCLRTRSATRPHVDDEVLLRGLDALFGPDPADLQRLAAAAAVRSAFAVVAGGPGTGKTTTVARIIALLDRQAVASGSPPPRVALAAPTGKAAARLEESVHDEAHRLALGSEVSARLLGLSAATLHRLLGWRPGTRSRFRHDRDNHLPFDVVIVDETSMVSTSMMAHLVDAVAPEARLILVGDPDQLASVEAGAVLGDIVDPAAVQRDQDSSTSIASGIVVLERVHRFGGAIADLAAAVRHGDVGDALGVLRAGHADVTWLERLGDATGSALGPIREHVVTAGRRLVDAARDGDARSALAALGQVRVLCAHRLGSSGVAGWTAQIERWLAESIDGYTPDGLWYVGRPLLVTANDHALRLYNGDTGVIVRSATHGVVAAFPRGGSIVELSPRRISAIDTVHAMTIHKSQGSQFETVAAVLPEPGSPILTRELLYTAITRAQQRVIVVGTEECIDTAVTRPITRATGLRERLWGHDPR